MLQHLRIKNFALIDSTEINFSDGLSVITGETGAGKSILLGALGMVLGDRADLSSIRDASIKCIIEAHFQIDEESFKGFFQENDLDFETTCILRREITPSGKSRSFINDTPVTLKTLNRLGKELVDIHSQNETGILLDPARQFVLLDSFIATRSEGKAFKTILEEYQLKFKEQSRLQKRLSQIERDQIALQKELDYNLFQLEELQEAHLDKVDMAALEDELQTLENVEAISTNLSVVLNRIEQDEMGLMDGLRETVQNLQSISSFSKTYSSFFSRFESLQIELADLTDEIQHSLDSLQDDPERREEVTQKMDAINRLLTKHHVSELSELIALRDELVEKVNDTQSSAMQIEQLNVQIAENRKLLEDMADKLFQQRKKLKPQLEKSVLDTISKLGMKAASFEISLTESKELGALGKSEIQFLFSANKGGKLLPVQKAASGGELSRVMLGIKNEMANTKGLNTIIFDEIDTGVSGHIADKMASIMREMSDAMQVISITHLPQIAAAGHQHFTVEKNELQDKTVSGVRLLEKDDRTRELAKMLSSGQLTAAARSNAAELLGKWQ